MKNISKNGILLTFIFIVALFVRLTSLDKPEGLWNDEYMAWWISTAEFGKPLFSKIMSNCHMPLYYIFLKIWTSMFGHGDIVLRLSSVFVGMLGVFSMYFLGKEYKDEKAGIICALFSALSGFLIYFSQEVRLYGLVFLISVWLSFFFIKSVRKLGAKTFWLYILCNFLLLITHTIGFVYVFFNLLIFSIIMLKKYPRAKNKFYIAYGLMFLLFLPFVPFLFDVLTRETLSQNWGIFNFSKVLFVFIDYLTPVQTNITNSELNLFAFFASGKILEHIIFVLLPLIIGLYFINRSAKKSFTPELRALSVCAVLYFLVLVIAAMFGKLVLSTKYSIEIYPALILLFVAGIVENPARKVRNLAVIYFVTVATFVMFNPNAPQKLMRPEGHKAAAELINNVNMGNDDYLILLYHQIFRYEKYLKQPPKNVIEINKASIISYLLDYNSDAKEFKNNGKNRLKDAFLLDKNANKIINERFDKIYKKIPRGGNISILIPTQVAFFSSGDLKRIASNKKEYKQTQLLFMAFSFAKIKLINEAFKYCEFVSMDENGSWILLTFKKI